VEILASLSPELIYRSIVESTDDSVYLVDNECRYLYLNPRHLNRLGLDPDHYQGTPYSHVHDLEHSHRFESMIKVIIGKSQPVTDEYERDGRWFARRFSPIKDESTGNVIAVTVSSTEITPLKKAEDELRLRNKYLTILNEIISSSMKVSRIEDLMATTVKKTSDMLNFNGGGIYLLDKQQRFENLIYNEGITENTVEKIKRFDITKGNTQPFDQEKQCTFIEFSSELHEGYRSLGAESVAYIHLFAGQQRIGSFFIFSRSPHSFTSGEKEILQSIGMEIGAALFKLRLQDELLQANNESNLYIDIMAHDINNANTLSIGYAELLTDMLDGELKQYATNMMGGIYKSREIIKIVEVLRRIRTSNTPLHPVGIDPVVMKEISLFPKATIHYTPSGYVVMADDLFSEVLTNLIGNSLKFGGPGTNIWINTKDQGDFIELSIEDTGPGIADSLKPVIFERFSRGDTKKPGKGLGLYIIKSLIDRYGGTIRVEDRVPGDSSKGAAIRFTLAKATT
jgi:two-component system, OmpR family, sensor histidine kinase KdpD